MRLMNIGKREYRTKDGILKPNEVMTVSEKTGKDLLKNYASEFRFIDDSKVDTKVAEKEAKEAKEAEKAAKEAAEKEAKEAEKLKKEATAKK